MNTLMRQVEIAHGYASTKQRKFPQFLWLFDAPAICPDSVGCPTHHMTEPLRRELSEVRGFLKSTYGETRMYVDPQDWDELIEVLCDLGYMNRAVADVAREWVAVTSALLNMGY